MRDSIGHRPHATSVRVMLLSAEDMFFFLSFRSHLNKSSAQYRPFVDESDTPAGGFPFKEHSITNRRYLKLCLQVKLACLCFSVEIGTHTEGVTVAGASAVAFVLYICEHKNA